MLSLKSVRAHGCMCQRQQMQPQQRRNVSVHALENYMIEKLQGNKARLQLLQVRPGVLCDSSHASSGLVCAGLAKKRHRGAHSTLRDVCSSLQAAVRKCRP